MNKKTFKDYVLATRPWSLPASSMSVVTSAMYMWWICTIFDRHFDWLNAVLALLGMMFFQMGGNLASDYHDYTSGVDKPGEESVQILTSGLFSKKEVAWFAAIMLGIGSLLGIVIFLRSGLPVLVIGVLGLLLAVFYYFLKYHALGDLCIFLEYAILPMLGTSYAVAGFLYWPILLLACIVGPVTVAILHANNARDIPSDRASGIKTFAMIIGLKASQWKYGAETLLPFVLLGVGIAIAWLPVTAALAFAALPRAININRQVASLMDSPLPFSGIDQRTADLQLRFSLMLSAGLALAQIL